MNTCFRASAGRSESKTKIMNAHFSLLRATKSVPHGFPTLVCSSSNRNTFIWYCKILLSHESSWGTWKAYLHNSYLYLHQILPPRYVPPLSLSCLLLFFLAVLENSFSSYHLAVAAVLHFFLLRDSRKRPLWIDALFFRFYPEKTGLASEFDTHSPTRGEKITVTRFFHFIIRRKPKSALSLLFLSH